MDNKLNDISSCLDSEIDVTDIYKKIDLETDFLWENNTSDIKGNLDNIDLWLNKNSSIVKNNTKNFDSIFKDKRLKDIELIKKNNLRSKIFLYLKWKISFSWKPISIFKKKFLFSKNFFNKILIVFSLLASFLFIDKYLVEYKINSGYDKILSIKDNSWDIDFVKSSINNAKFDFIVWDILFKPFLMIPNENIKNWYYVLQWWKDLTKLLDKSIQMYLATKEFIENNGWIEEIRLTNLLSNLRYDFSEITLLLYSTILNYDHIWELPNEGLDSKLDFAKSKLKYWYKMLDTLNKDFDIFLDILWHNEKREYLIVFQNNDEIRATWWFMWSLATVTIEKWKVKNLKKDDIYAYEWEINKVFKDKNLAPKWLDKITKTFWLRDANYYVDFDKSSNNINFFLKKIDKKVDWIIYINQNTILDFLRLTWWIKFPELNETITEENFSLIISTLVEAQSFKVWTLSTPKQVLFDFANIFISKLKEDKDYFAYLDIILKNIKSRDLVIYSFNSNENNLLWKFWLNWKLNYSDTLDYSYPVYTSIWWNKSDRYIEIKYKKDIIENVDCSIDTNLNIYRTHFFSKFEEKRVNDLLDKYPIKSKTRKDIINIQWRWVNKAFTRVILPKEAIVKNKEWLNIYKYKNSTVVDFYINTRLLESTLYDISYRLPNKKCEPYSYKLYKQPWIRDYNIEIKREEELIKELWIENDFYYE